MGDEIKTGEAAPAAESAKPNTAAGVEFPHEMMQGVFERFGKKLPESKTPEEKPTEAAEAAPAAAHEKESTESAEGETAATAAAAAEQAEESAPEQDDGAGEEQAEGAAEHSADPETEKIVAKKLKDLPPEQRKLVQSIIDGRIGEITAKSKGEVERLGNRVVELANELEATKKQGSAPVVIPGVHPALLAESPAEIENHVRQMDQFEDWAEQYKETGYQGDPEKGEPSYTSEQIRARLREVKRERETVIPQARANLQTRATLDSQLKTFLPQLFDPKSNEYAMAKAALKALPEIRKFPDVNVIVAQQILGQRALQGLMQKHLSANGQTQPAAAAAGAKKQATPPPPKKAPRAPGSGSPARGSVLDMPNDQPAADTAVKTAATMRNRDSLKAAVSALVFR